MPRYGVILVHTTAAAMRGEALLNRAALAVKLIPVPRNLSSDCGLAIRILTEDREQALAVLAKEHVDVAGVHDMG